MQSLHEIYADLGRRGHQSDKGTVHSYIDVYAEVLAPYRLRPGLRFLEIGLFRGDSLRMWEAYFHQAAGDTYFQKRAEIWGVDTCDRPIDGMADLRPMIAEGGHNIALLNAEDPAQIEWHFNGMMFDVIIEDASHGLGQQLAIYANFRARVAPGGLYVIEDIADLDATRSAFETIDPAKQVTILDRRSLKQRFDDVLVLIR